VIGSKTIWIEAKLASSVFHTVKATIGETPLVELVETFSRGKVGILNGKAAGIVGTRKLETKSSTVGAVS